ncbi:hypothetical protein HanXRQr2_Chr12g0540651 [Helianthus annuus]|uniref:Uncharacterized protein n=1 Tax=Helianthus annuus TaxID=4232 RepID=A0A9K3HGJ6_HELAN|nr:hypothetical protein HanXRQr2_Chr12g0540651 [Helianthus annuus]KAJ0862622.1 hypothetical protein HanPSC8_Chr12g0520401 [Helianthus annuus]
MSCHTSSLYCNQPPLHQRNRTKKGKVERENVQAVMVLTTVVLKSHSCHFTLQFKLPGFTIVGFLPADFFLN